MKWLKVFALGWLLLAMPGLSVAADKEEAIQQILEQQVKAWNRGELTQFVASYAEHCTLVGSTIEETTRREVLAHYQRKYPSEDSRGKLSFSGLTIHRLDAQVATVTGHWHLDRKSSAGGPVGGLFSLVFKLTDGKWQIAVDHTS